MSARYEDLKIWQSGYKIALQAYRISKIFPKEEMYGLTSQMRRSATSIPSNIAEGALRGSKKEFAQFLYIARGSLAEFKTQLRLAHDLGYLEMNTYKEMNDRLDELGKMINGFLSSLTTTYNLQPTT